MDANRQSQVKAAKAVAEQARATKQKNDASLMFSDATSIEQVLAYLAGAASVSWSKRPQGVFDTDMASSLVDIAKAKLDELYTENLRQAIDRSKKSTDFKDLHGLIDEDGCHCGACEGRIHPDLLATRENPDLTELRDGSGQVLSVRENGNSPMPHNGEELRLDELEHWELEVLGECPGNDYSDEERADSMEREGDHQ